jgi:hypothetical protein
MVRVLRGGRPVYSRGVLPTIITSPTDGRHRLWDPRAEDFVGVWEPDQLELAKKAMARIKPRRRAAAPAATKRVEGPFLMRPRAEAFLPVNPDIPYAQEFSHGWLVWNPLTRAWTGRTGLGAMTRAGARRTLASVAAKMNNGEARGR